MSDDGHDWRHGWIPLTHSAAVQKAKGDRKLADRLLRRGRAAAKAAPAKTSTRSTTTKRKPAKRDPLVCRSCGARSASPYLADLNHKIGADGVCVSKRLRASQTDAAAQKAARSPAATRPGTGRKVRVVELLADGRTRIVERDPAKAPSKAEVRYQRSKIEQERERQRKIDDARGGEVHRRTQRKLDAARRSYARPL